MKVQVQWAQDRPKDFCEVDSSVWAYTAPRPAPHEGRRDVDERDGYINELNVMGCRVTADVYAVEPIDNGGVRVTAVNRDEHSGWTPDKRYARVLDIYPPAPDANFGGAVNTRITQRVYTDNPVFKNRPGHRTSYYPWAAFRMPPSEFCRYGVQLDDRLYKGHVRCQHPRGWRTWTDGVDKRFLARGKIRDQRKIGLYNKPFGTKTFYANNVASATGVHGANNELEFGASPAGAVSVSSGNIGVNGALAFVFTSIASEPNEAQWPAGIYRAQLEVDNANIDLEFAVGVLGNGNGHFARVDSGLTTDLETKVQVEGAFSLSGLFLATTGGTTWAAGSAADRWEVAIASQRVAGHGNATFSMQLGELDDFTDGPWTAVAPTVSPKALTFGMGL